MDIDLKQFSTDDLAALQVGDLTKLSTPGLKILQRAQRIEQMKKDNPGEYDPASKEWQDKYGATSSMSTTDKVLSGAGKAFMDIKRGVGQLIGTDSQADIDEAKRLDAPLMKTTSGKVGNIGGNVAIALPSMFIPGAQGVGGAALTGAAMGAIQPVETGESRLKNTAIGAAAGAGGVVAGRVIAAGAKGAKALVEPFTKKGQEAIAGRTLERFGVGAGDVAQATDQATITGARPMLAEQIADPAAAAGAARLQDAVRSMDPQIAGKLAAREAENNAARVGTLTELAGKDGARDFAGAARKATSEELYGKAFADSKPYSTAAWKAEVLKEHPGAKFVKEDGSGLTYGEKGDWFAHTGPDMQADVVGTYSKNSDLAQTLSKTTQDFVERAIAPKASTPAQQTQIAKLLQMPAVKDAVAAARETAANRGVNIAAPEGSVEGLHLMKLAMDDQISALSNGTASQVNKAMSIKMAQKKLLDVLEDMSPAYKEARLTHAAMSKPLNQMDTAAEVLKRGTSATTDLSGNARLMPDALARAARDEGKLITQATGRDLPQKTLADLLEPEQLAKLQGVLKETDRGAAVARAANGPGSATADRLASQNVLRQVLGPTGLPQSWAESTLLNTAMRPVQFAYNGVAEPKIQAVLADLVMNPARAQAVLQAARSGGASRLPKDVQAALPYLEQALKTSAPAAALQR